MKSWRTSEAGGKLHQAFIEIVELKIWHGEEYNERGKRQLADYLDYYHKEKGYMLSFNFKKKEIGVKEIQIGEKTIVEAVV